MYLEWGVRNRWIFICAMHICMQLIIKSLGQSSLDLYSASRHEKGNVSSIAFTHPTVLVFINIHERDAIICNFPRIPYKRRKNDTFVVLYDICAIIIEWFKSTTAICMMTVCYSIHYNVLLVGTFIPLIRNVLIYHKPSKTPKIMDSKDPDLMIREVVWQRVSRE